MASIINVTLTGVQPLLMHSARFANPLDPLTKAHKELTSKRKKTDDDQLAIARSEFIGGCYYSEESGIHIPSVNLESCFWAAAKLQKLGKKFDQAQVTVLEDEVPLIGKHPKTPEALWDAGSEYVDVRGVKVQTARIMRYRPKFKQWQLKFTLAFNNEVLNKSEVTKFIQDAGQMIGLGDYNKKFGRFEVEFN